MDANTLIWTRTPYYGREHPNKELVIPTIFGHSMTLPLDLEYWKPT